MRKVAGYRLDTGCSPGDRETRMDRIAREVTDWLRSKGTIHEGENAASLELARGGFADLHIESIEIEDGALRAWALMEFDEERQFRTVVQVAGLGEHISLRCVLEVGGFGDIISPLSFDARTPHVIRRLLNLEGMEWTLGAEPILNRKRSFTDRAEGDEFARLVWANERSYPVVAVSQDQGMTLHPDIGDMLAYDLAGLAIVAQLGSAASWRLTEVKSREWSVYGGAIRLYWPRPTERDNPFAHPLWTPRRLLSGVGSVNEAVERIRRQLRRKVLGASAFSMQEPEIHRNVRRTARREELEELKRRAEEEGGHKEVAEELFAQLLEVQEERDSQDEYIRDLEEQRRNLQEALRWHPPTDAISGGEVDEVAPETESPPVTIEEAVSRATERFGTKLTFGEDVKRGVATLSPDAGPPEKVLTYLEHLNELAHVLSQGPLGESVGEWLQKRGVSSSSETQLTKNSEQERLKRTWGDGEGGRQYFDFHLKPNESTSPDRCVRIYCDVDGGTGKVLVGWVGRHP